MHSNRYRQSLVLVWCVALIGCQRPSVDRLIAQLDDGDPRVRRAAVQALSEHAATSTDAWSALNRALSDDDDSVRISAALAIARTRPNETSFQAVLVEALEAGRGPIFVEIGQFGGEAGWAEPTLVKLLNHPQPQIRALAAKTLGQIGVSSEAEPQLRRRFQDESAAVRKAARTALQPRDSDPADRAAD